MPLALPLALPLGELSPQVTERALALPLGELSPQVTERALALPRGAISYIVKKDVSQPKHPFNVYLIESTSFSYL